jgi:hypothetical protein
MERLQTDPGFSIQDFPPATWLGEGSLQPAPLCPQLSGSPSSFLVVDGYEYIYAISILYLQVYIYVCISYIHIYYLYILFKLRKLY